jgi:hypothetical protein
VAWDKGFNFRFSFDFVTDPADHTYVVSNTYPVTRNAVTFGFEQPPSAGRDRNSGVDARLAGINYRAAPTQADFRVDLPAAGQYLIRLAMGDQANPQTVYWQFLDTTTVLATYGELTTTGGAYFYDASGVERITVADWVSNNASQTYTFATTILRLRIGFTSGVNNSAVATLFVSQLGPTITQQITSQTVRVGDLATFTISATGTDLHYDWEVDRGKGFLNVPPGATDSASYQTPILSLSDEGAVYRCNVVDSGGAIAVSSSATLHVKALAYGLAGDFDIDFHNQPWPELFLSTWYDDEFIAQLLITQQPGTQTVRVGDKATFKISATAGWGVFHYDWEVDTGGGFANASGATDSPTYQTPVLGLGDEGAIYRCNVTDGNNAITVSSSATLHVKALTYGSIGDFDAELLINAWW